VGKKDSFTGELEALFNPSQLTYQAGLTWTFTAPVRSAKSSSAGVTEFKGITPETLSLSLFFDTYAKGSPAPARAPASPVPPTAPPAESVTRYTDKVMKLAQIDKDLHRPPLCKLTWGNRGWDNGEIFRGVLQRVSRTYTLFLDDGTPVRATMECTFVQVPQGSELRSADVVKRAIVRPGDTLMSIAAAFYGDVAQWRRIAEANGIEDPRRLTPGRALVIPRIE
jgi:nucleoid-associated protein YgaU